MSAPLQPPRQMAVQLVGFLGLPWRLWGYLGSTLFLWGFLVLVLFPVGLLSKGILILMPFLGAVCLAWPRGGRHLDEWLALAWGYYRAKHRAERKPARHRLLTARATSSHPEERSLAPWEALPSFEEADVQEAADLDEEAPPWAEESAAHEVAWEEDADLARLPSSGIFARRSTQSATYQAVERLPRSTVLTAPSRPHDLDLDWDEETGTLFDTTGAYLLDVGLRHAGPAHPKPPSHRGRIIPMPMPMPRPHQHAVGHEE